MSALASGFVEPTISATLSDSCASASKTGNHVPFPIPAVAPKLTARVK